MRITYVLSNCTLYTLMQFNHNIISICRCCFGSCMNSAQEGDPPFRIWNLPYSRRAFIRMKRPLEEFFRKMSEFIARTTDFWTHLISDFQSQGDYYKSVWFHKAKHLKTEYEERPCWLRRLDYRPRSYVCFHNKKGVS